MIQSYDLQGVSSFIDDFSEPMMLKELLAGTMETPMYKEQCRRRNAKRTESQAVFPSYKRITDAFPTER